MCGEYNIRIRTKKLEYQLNIRRNFTVITGDSATGKTVLYDLVEAVYNKQGFVQCQIQPINTQNKPSLAVITDGNWEVLLANLTNTIFFVDEQSSFIHTNKFETKVRGTDNYFVFITRHFNKLKGIPISINEIYELRAHGKYHDLQPCYVNEYTRGNTLNMHNVNVCITEDSGSGRSFMKYCLPVNVSVIGASGNGDVLNQLQSVLLTGSDNIVIIADAAAFGPYIQDILYAICYVNKNICLKLPESFEYLLLHSQIFSGCYTNLQNFYPLIDSRIHESWEQFFTDLLCTYAKQLGFTYSKRRGMPNMLKTKATKRVVLQLLRL